MDSEPDTEVEDKQPGETTGNEDTGWTPTNDVLAANHNQLSIINMQLRQLVEFTDLINFIIKLACYAIIGAAIGWVLGTLINLAGHTD